VLLILALATSLFATTRALHGGWHLSQPNVQFALYCGTFGYAGCRFVSLIPVATSVSSITKFAVCGGVNAFLFYCYIVLIASC
jgi:hypothetical protein